MRAMRIAAIAGAVLALAACTPAPSADTSEPAPTAPQSVSATPTPDATDEASDQTDFGTAEFSDRGNLIKQLGQPAGITEYDVQTAVFSVTELVLDLECTSGFSDRPANGHYLGVRIDIETLPELAESDYPFVTITSYDWQAFDSTGMRLNDAQGNAWSCLDAASQLPNQLGPGQRASGWIVLDVVEPTGSVALVLPGFDGGWEWAY